jgi:hypothetical protein
MSMAIAKSATASQAHTSLDGPTSLIEEIRDFWRLFFVAAFNPYRPELHYMRGPGPAWRAKHGKAQPPAR